MNQFLETWGYLAIFVLTVLESACIPIPSEVTLGLSGALASGAVIAGSPGELDLAGVILVGTLGSVVGSLIAYVVGRTGGRALLERYGRYLLVTRSDLDQVERWFARRGEAAVLVGRVVPVVRTFISFPAGVAEMKVPKFLVFTTIGVAAWVALLSSLGYALGSSWESVTKGFSDASYIVAAVAVAVIIVVVVFRVRALRRERIELEEP